MIWTEGYIIFKILTCVEGAVAPECAKDGKSCSKFESRLEVGT